MSDDEPSRAEKRRAVRGELPNDDRQRPSIGAPEPALGGGIDPGIAPDVETGTAAILPDELTRTRPDTDDDPTPALACLDCETSWLGKSEWVYCPLCGTELTELEVRADE